MKKEIEIPGINASQVESKAALIEVLARTLDFDTLKILSDVCRRSTKEAINAKIRAFHHLF